MLDLPKKEGAQCIAREEEEAATTISSTATAIQTKQQRSKNRAVMKTMVVQLRKGQQQIERMKN